MKKLILVVLAIAITAGAYAQIDSTTRKTNLRDKNNNQNQYLQNNPVDKSLADGVVMQNGKMMQVKNGQTTLLDRELTMTNGTKIMANGTCTKKDGSKMTLKEGQHMDMSGNMTTKDKNMYLVPDSTKKKGY